MVVVVSIGGLLCLIYPAMGLMYEKLYTAGFVTFTLFSAGGFILFGLFKLREGVVRGFRLHDPSTGKYVGVDILVHDDPNWRRFTTVEGLDIIKKCLLKRKCSKPHQPSNILEEWEDGCRHYHPQSDTIKKRIPNCTNRDSSDNTSSNVPEVVSEEKDATDNDILSLINGDLPNLETTTQMVETALKIYPDLLPPGIDENVKKAVIKFVHKGLIDMCPDLCKLESLEEQMAFARDRFTSMIKAYNDT